MSYLTTAMNTLAYLQALAVVNSTKYSQTNDNNIKVSHAKPQYIM